MVDGTEDHPGPSRELRGDEDADDARQESNVARPRVRITGAQQVGDVTMQVPAVGRPPESLDRGHGSKSEAEPASEPRAPTALPDPVHESDSARAELPHSPPMPHWSEPPTGQVPAVLVREDRDSSIAGPTWREDRADWEAHDEFDASIFAAEGEVPLGSLDESDEPDLERRPWEFAIEGESGTDESQRGDGRVQDELPWTAAGELPREGGGPADELDSDATADLPVGDEADAPGPEGSIEPPAELPARPRSGGARPGVRPIGGRLRPRRAMPEEANGRSMVGGAEETDVPGAPSEGPPEGGPGQAGSRVIKIGTGDVPAAGVPAAPSHAGGARRGRAGSRRLDADLGPDERPGAAAWIRILTGAAAGIIALGAFALGTVSTMVLVVAVLTFAAGEVFGVVRRAGYHPATLLGLVGTATLSIVAYTKGPSAIPLVLVLIVAFTFVWYLLKIDDGTPVRGIGATMLVVAWVGLFGSFAGLLLSPGAYPQRTGIAFLLAAIVATVGADVGGLIAGSLIGRHQLAPSISPGKTWEGLVGGVVLAVLLSLTITANVHPWNAGKAVVLALLVAVVAPIGDLAESMLKRDLGLKDMGSLLPGHGGVMDRIDGLLIALPLTFYVVRAFHLA